MLKTSSVLSKTTSGRPLVNIDEHRGYRKFIQPFHRRKFFLNNFFRLLSFCLIPVLILGSLSIFITQRYIGEGIESDNVQTLNQYGDYLKIIVEEMDSLSLSFDQDPKILMMLKRVLTKKNFTYDEREALFYLRNVIDVPANSKPYIHSVYIYYQNSERKFLSSREGITDSDPFFDQAWLDELKEQFASSEFITKVRQIQEFDIKNTSRKMITVSKQIANGKGIIAINIDPSYFERSFTSLQKYADQAITITDQEGQTIMQSGPNIEMTPLIIEKRGQSDETGQTISFAESDQHITIKSISRLEWSLMTSVQSHAMYGLIRTLIGLTIMLSLLSVMISGLFAYRMTLKNYRQLYTIIKTLNYASQHETLKSTDGEVGDLYELILQNILDNFLQQRYMKIQLSERKYREEVMELRALQSQINPHFLSNTLHSIYWKCIELTRSPNEVSNMIEYLSEILEYAIRVDEELVSLEEELLYCRNYVDIQLLRHSTELSVLWESEEGFEAYKILKLSLQPLLENSIQYGLEENDTESLSIKIKFRLGSNILKVTVIDNGPGIAREKLTEIEARLSSDIETADHVGLTNTFRRLGLKYGAFSKIRIISKPTLGTAVTLYFPQ